MSKTRSGERQSPAHGKTIEQFHEEVTAAREAVLGGKTQMGTFLKPLLDDLSKVERLIPIEETFKIVHDFFKGKSLADIKLTPPDVLCLLTDPTANFIRKLVINKHIADRFDKEFTVTGDSEQRVKGSLLTLMSGLAWSDFGQNPHLRKKIIDTAPEDVCMHPTAASERIKSAASSNPGLALSAFDSLLHIADEVSGAQVPMLLNDFNLDYGGSPKGEMHFLTEPGHAFKAGLIVGMYKNSTLRHLQEGKSRLYNFVKPCRFMLVEDDVHYLFWATILDGAENLIRCQPPEGMRTGNTDIDDEEKRGFYRTAERARDAIYSTPGTPPPDLILADIELGPGMNGLDFIEEVYRRETEAGRKPIILMAYSSNPAPYQERIKRLQDAGIIKGAWNKKDFSYELMVDETNKILAETR